MNKRAVVLACCFAMLAAMLAYAQSDDFQMARVVSFEKLAANEQHPEYADRYKIAFQLPDAMYICQAHGSPATFLDWAPNKQFPAKVADKKTMLVKNFNGDVLQMVILSRKGPK